MIQTRALNGSRIGEVDVIDCVRTAADRVRIFVGPGVGPAAIGPAGGVSPERVLSIGGALAVECRAGGPGPMPVPIHGVEGTLSPASAEPELLADARVIMGARNGQAVATVRDWLGHHVLNHGADAALILDRTRPGEAPLAPDLEAALSQAPVPGLGAVVVVTSPLPLGADAISERHPAQAPDAPGKDRMAMPASDPWTAPLGQMIVLEALRWRFLTAARAVAFLDVSDVLAPAATGQGAFDMVEIAEAGVVALIGRRTYPWRIRKGCDPAFGDHICDLFDNESGNRRWVAAPSRIAENVPFRLVRVGGLKPGPNEVAHFYRAMALRTSEAGGLPLAPKTGLILDDDLLALARDGFGADPVLPPQSDGGGVAGLPASVPGRTAIITCMRNEGPFILEWIAHHRAIGVDDFLVYTNDCTDGTVDLLDLLQSHGIVQRRDNPFRETDMKPQHAALAAAEAEPIMARAGWAVCMDVDEFINIHAGTGHLRDLYAAVGSANMISMTWRLFGNDGAVAFEDVPSPARFTACAPELIRKPHQAWGFKTLFRNIGIYKKMGVHRPKGLKPDLWEQIDWVNGSGRQMPRAMLRNGWRSTIDTFGYDLVTLNHYAVRDAESFLVKRDRGRVNHVERDQGLGYWFRMNNNAVRDRSIQRMLPALEAELARLKALPGVAAQHDACCAAHRTKIAELRGAGAFAKFYDEITGPRMDRLSRMHAHFGSNVFLAGPDAVPDEVVAAEHPEDFFFTVEDVGETRH
ncbi:glycosyltransferase family 2 protein [Jannaschia sp. S6380]|uniref:glycosyltransferase family 2 protein n=1 Tax=Jannaschia sp. S6380 TaxID=2926408 RepID=UPI001FF45CEC|nr:glycosyltransferase family 2 protein [Jannaschia sp. S6380]MCK0166327.1 glycosyltransferase family 2 protein [Jannaschia sp. S6380]